MSVWDERVAAAYDGLGGVLDPTYGPLHVDVPVDRWADALAAARDVLGCTFFDFLTAVDEQPDGFRLVCHVAAHRPGAVEQLVVRTLVPGEAGSVASVQHVYAGAAWHERETAEMFGLSFTDPAGEPLALAPLLLPDGFGAHPLRKDFVLASRVVRSWPGAKEPGESEHDASPSRRRTRPPGVPEDWPTQPGATAAGKGEEVGA